MASCQWCSNPHASSEHRCGRCKEVGHPGFAKHCDVCGLHDCDKSLHTCNRYRCKTIGDHSHSCDLCLENHITSEHVCSTCMQLGHADYQCQFETFCDICRGKMGHLTKHHYDCERCCQNVVTRHVGCSSCSGCAAESHPPIIWYMDMGCVKCNKCNEVWDSLDEVIYESYYNALDSNEI